MSLPPLKKGDRVEIVGGCKALRLRRGQILTIARIDHPDRSLAVSQWLALDIGSDRWLLGVRFPSHLEKEEITLGNGTGTNKVKVKRCK